MWSTTFGPKPFLKQTKRIIIIIIFRIGTWSLSLSGSGRRRRRCHPISDALHMLWSTFLWRVWACIAFYFGRRRFVCSIDIPFMVVLCVAVAMCTHTHTRGPAWRMLKMFVGDFNNNIKSMLGYCFMFKIFNKLYNGSRIHSSKMLLDEQCPAPPHTPYVGLYYMRIRIVRKCFRSHSASKRNVTTRQY